MFLIDKIQELMEYDSAEEENHIEWLNKWHVLVYEYGSLIWEIEDINVKILQKCKSIRNNCKDAWSKEVAKKFGALINRFKHSSAIASAIIDNMKMARSRVFDAEYTIETSRLAKQQILANASAAMLAQANMAKQSTLVLLE